MSTILCSDTILDGGGGGGNIRSFHLMQFECSLLIVLLPVHINNHKIFGRRL
jgi:hypothetical protein